MSFEIDRERHEAARDYLDRAGLGERVDLRLEDARSGLESLRDRSTSPSSTRSSRSTATTSRACFGLLRPGALIVVDNVLMSGTVATGQPDGDWSEAHIANARAFNERLSPHPEIEVATVTPVGDGVALAVRR